MEPVTSGQDKRKDRFYISDLFMNGVSIIIPTLNESENIARLIPRIFTVMAEASIDTEVVVVDDGSTDGTREKVRELAVDSPVTLVCRDHKSGLASAVIDGAQAVSNDVVIVMDGDLSHPTEVLPQLAQPLLDDQFDVAIGSRYTKGGETPGWPLIRRLGSRVASFPAQLLTGVDDPLAGFFGIKKERLLAVKHDIPGYKICLEMLITQFEHPKVIEVPISFHDRQAGVSKMTGSVLKAYLLQLLSLVGLSIPVRFGARFAVLALTGLLADITVFTVSLWCGATLLLSQVAGLLVSFGVMLYLHRQGKVNKDDKQVGLLLHNGLFFLVLLVLRSGFLVLFESHNWFQSALFFIPIALLSSCATSCYSMFIGPSLERGQPNSVAGYRLMLFGGIVFSFALRILFGGSFELLKEEAYYWNYAQHLDIGYLDHPPMVAVLIKFGTFFFGNTEFGIRVSAILCWLLATFFVVRYTREISNRDTALAAAAIMAVVPAFVAFGFLMTPDPPLIACWAGALYYGRRAMVDMDAKSWLGTGIFIGLGLFSKYTMVLIGPAFVAYMLVDPRARRWLIRPQPYGAAILAFILFLPVIWWNMENGWASFLFQTQGRLESSSEFSTHELLGSIFILLGPVGFIGALFVLLFPAKFAKMNNERGKRNYRFGFTMVVVPLTVFLFFSLTKEVKFNWTSPLWLAILPYMAQTLPIGVSGLSENAKTRFFSGWKITIVVFLLCYGVVLNYFSLGFPGVPYPADGPMFGWKKLAVEVNSVIEETEEQHGRRPLVVGMDLYKSASGLAFYRTRIYEQEGKPDRPHPIDETLGRVMSGMGALMYEYWFPPERYRGRMLLLVSQDQRDIKRFPMKRGGRRPILQMVGSKNNQPTGLLYYRLLDWQPIDPRYQKLSY